MGDEPDGDDESTMRRVCLSIPTTMLGKLLEVGPVDDNIQDAIKRAIWNQIERDKADAYTVEKTGRKREPVAVAGTGYWE